MSSAALNELEQSLREQLRLSESALADRLSDLHSVDDELVTLRKQQDTYEKVESICAALEELDEISASACCGTAAVITWINRIVDEDREWTFAFDERWQRLYDALVGIQTATQDDPFGWRHEIPT